MARYTGPKTKIARKFGEPIFGEDKSFEKKNYPPGQHGNNRRRGKKSEYAIQLMEKQKAKYTYGILERQFRNLFKKANQSKGVTGEVLLQLCESRLDNIVYRLGIASTRSAARQLVSHRHITVDGVLCNIPRINPVSSHSSRMAATARVSGEGPLLSFKSRAWQSCTKGLARGMTLSSASTAPPGKTNLFGINAAFDPR